MFEIETAVDSVLAEKQCGQDTNRVILTVAAGWKSRSPKYIYEV